MRTSIPQPIERAIAQGIAFFTGEAVEWKLEIKGRDEYIEKHAQCRVLVFANNGFGDSLFLKEREDGDGFSERAFEFSHEGPVVYEIAEDLELLLGLRERPPSSVAPPTYSGGEPLMLGDTVEIRSFFRKKIGTIVYVPGISKRDPGLEFGGISMALVRHGSKGDYTITVDPDTNVLIGRISLIGRKDAEPGGPPGRG